VNDATGELIVAVVDGVTQQQWNLQNALAIYMGKVVSIHLNEIASAKGSNS